MMNGLLLLVAMVPLANQAAAEAPKGAPDKFAQLKWAYRRGDAITTISLLNPLLSQPKETIAGVDGTLKKRKLPGVAELLMKARLLLAGQGLAETAPKPELAELVLILPALQAHLTREYQAIAGHAVLNKTFQVPGALKDYTDIVWTLYGFENRIEQLKADAAYLAQLVKRLPRKGDDLPADVVRLADGKIASNNLKQIKALQGRLLEREFEVRYRRLQRTHDTLQRKELTAEHILAAGTWRIDHHKLTQFLASEELPPSLAKNKKQLLTTIERFAEQSKTRAGPLTAKAELFFDGLFWWTRGRYGLGSHDFGLAKAPGANRNPALSLQLVLPPERPKPKSPAGKKTEGTPRFPRRHYHWWSNGRQLDSTEEASPSSQDYERYLPIYSVGFR